MTAMEPTCALWYWRYDNPYYFLCDDEQEAVSMAIGMEDSGDASVQGVQFADGRYVDYNDWTLLDETRERQWAEEAEQYRQEQENPKPKPATRTIKVPGMGRDYTIEVEIDQPSWLGKLT